MIVTQSLADGWYWVTDPCDPNQVPEPARLETTIRVDGTPDRVWFVTGSDIRWAYYEWTPHSVLNKPEGAP